MPHDFILTQEGLAKKETDIQRENRWLRALIAMHTAQREHTKLPTRGTKGTHHTSQGTFTDSELVDAMKNYQQVVHDVAAHFNVSVSTIYIRLRRLPPGSLSGHNSKEVSLERGWAG